MRPPTSWVETLREPRLGDGGLGTTLQSFGLPADQPPELWNLVRPEAVLAAHRAFAAAGSEWLQTNTFGATRARLERHGLGDRVAEVNRRAARLARIAAEGRLVLGSLGPTTDPDPRRWAAHYREQVAALAPDVDGLIVETIVNADEGMAAVRAARESGRPVVATFAVRPDGVPIAGGTAVALAERLLTAGAIAVGVNCGTGLAPVLRAVESLAAARLAPVIAQPSAGLPRTIEGVPRYNLAPSGFGDWWALLRAAGADWIGGCCGIDPDQIRSASARWRTLAGGD